MPLIDTHAHLYLDDFAADRDAVIKRAIDAGVKHVLLPGIDSGTHAEMLAMEDDYPDFCSAMMGLHPVSVKDTYKQELAVVKSYLDKRKFVAVGEIGLDFHWDLSYKQQQYEAFQQQIEWALDSDLPISIHSRDATDECIEVIEKYTSRGLRGVFHCFSGSVGQAQRVIATGFYLGIGGVLTFKNAGLDAVLATVDLKHVVLETDAPYLSPVPLRGKRNESSYLTYVTDKLATIRNLSKEEVETITTANAQNLFSF